MNFEEFKGLDPEEVAARCGGTSPADTGPNPGSAGEQEAIVADTEHTDDPADDVADEAVPAPAPRRVQLKASSLIEKLIEADPSLDEASAFKLLEEILNRGREDDKVRRVIRNANQFVPDWLGIAVEEFIGEQSAFEPAVADGAASQPFDQDAPSASAFEPAVDESDPSDPTEAEPTSGVDQYREVLRPLLIEAVQVWRRSGENAASQATLELANAFWDQGLLFYAALGASDDEAQQYLLQLHRKQQEKQERLFIPLEELKQDPNKRALAWYYRIAERCVALVCREGKSVDESLAEVNWPGENHLRRKLKRQQTEQQAVRSHSRTPADEQPAGEEDAEPQPDASEADATETEPSPIEVNEVDGRRVVSHGKPPSQGRRVVQGGGPKMRPPAKFGGIVEESAPEERPAETQPDKKFCRNDESILANLPEEVVLAMMQQVAADDDPVEHWAYRTPREQREEVDRRLLLEYGQHSAA